MTIGFSYIGLIWLIMLFVPNFIWMKNKPKDYEEYAKKENADLVLATDPDADRIGIAVSTKLGHAVKRNRIKRLIRSAYQSFDLKNESLDIVFFELL